MSAQACLAELPTYKRLVELGSSECLTSRSDDGQPLSLHLPNVQFSSAEYFASELDIEITVYVWRIGPLDGRTEVKYATVDHSAIGNINYVPTLGSLAFEPGENEKPITIKLLHDHAWSNTLDFNVRLEAPVGGRLGFYLYQSKVRLANQDPFPTERVDVESLEAERVSFVLLFTEYLRMQFQYPLIKSGTIKLILIDLCHNINLVFRLALMLYTIDDILDTDDKASHERWNALVLVLVLMTCPPALLHFLDWIKPSYRVAGRSRAVLQSALIRRFLIFDRTSRQLFRTSHLMMSTLYDADYVVTFGYMSFVSGIGSMLQLMFILVFQLLQPYFMHKPFVWTPLILFFVFPTCLSIYTWTRARLTSAAVHERHSMQKHLVDAVQGATDNSQLIADYSCRHQYMQHFEEHLQRYNSAVVDADRVFLNNSKGPEWVTSVCTAVYMYIEGSRILDGTGPKIGVFITTIALISKVGHEWATIYDLVLKMQMAAVNLRQISWFLNLSVDTNHRRMLAKAQHEMTVKLRAELRSKSSQGIPLDVMPIRIDRVNLSFAALFNASGHKSRGMLSNSKINLCSTGLVDIQQGILLALVGPCGEGKSTMLNLLSGNLLSAPPEDGHGYVFVPAHCRALNVSERPLFVHGSLMENLTLGLHLEGKPPPREKVERILRRMELSDHIIDFLDTEEVPSWVHVLSKTQQHLLSICRALVANFELTCIHKATQQFPDELARHVLEVLDEHVKNRGLGENPTTLAMRRPRTVIYTEESLDRIFGVKHVLTLCNATGLQWHYGLNREEM
eukprot:TRINITY_DN22528_c0_g2_i1.p1 TRINITY_DN22528_c0_g2~~TRINITY_DN22528_c0_g2_i1.p1  ORF type:complete len:792 (+),score=66.17 TRINITY_DN22528_c0_g2_i1:173-2548(+)